MADYFLSIYCISSAYKFQGLLAVVRTRSLWYRKIIEFYYKKKIIIVLNLFIYYYIAEQ